jgi:flagellar hook-basal body complex protein FliE
MIDRVNTSQLQDILANAAAKQARNTEAGQDRSTDASLQADYAALIKQASDACADDQIRLQKAKELLDTGQLETLDNVRQAAQDIAQFGV